MSWKAAALIALIASTASASPSGPIMMGVLGDSISAGTLADLPIPDRPGTITTEDLRARIILENKLTYSWASGVSIQSHYVRLAAYLRRHRERRPFFVDNVSVPGDVSADVEGQATQLVRAFEKGNYSVLKYVTLLIGSNDACSPRTPVGIPPQEIRSNLLRAFSILSGIRQTEPIRVLVVGIPRIPDLGEAALRGSRSIFGLKCDTIRSGILGECDPLLHWKTEAEYDHAMTVVEDDNRALRDLVAEVHSKFPNIEAVYSNRLYNLNIPRSVLSIDCFHPNASGQEKLAEQTWLDQPWFE